MARSLPAPVLLPKSAGRGSRRCQRTLTIPSTSTNSRVVHGPFCFQSKSGGVLLWLLPLLRAILSAWGCSPSLFQGDRSGTGTEHHQRPHRLHRRLVRGAFVVATTDGPQQQITTSPRSISACCSPVLARCFLSHWSLSSATGSIQRNFCKVCAC